MSGDAFGVVGRVLFLGLEACVLALNAVGLPGNWVLLALAAGYGLLSDMRRVGWGTLGVMAGLALVAEGLETVIGLAYTAKKGATRRGTLGAFLGGIVGAALTVELVPPFGPMLGAFGGTFLGAYLLEWLGERRRDTALRAGRAAFVGRILAAAVKTLCGFWMWCVLAYRLLAPVR